MEKRTIHRIDFNASSDWTYLHRRPGTTPIGVSEI
jgi:hypothetical protein